MAPDTQTLRIVAVERFHQLLMSEIGWDRLPREDEPWYALRGRDRITEVRLLYGTVNPGPGFVLWVWDQGPSSMLSDMIRAREELVFVNDSANALRGSRYEVRGEWSTLSTDAPLPEEIPRRVRLATATATIEIEEPEHAFARKGFCIPPNDRVERLVASALAAGETCVASLC